MQRRRHDTRQPLKHTNKHTHAESFCNKSCAFAEYKQAAEPKPTCKLSRDVRYGSRTTAAHVPTHFLNTGLGRRAECASCPSASLRPLDISRPTERDAAHCPDVWKTHTHTSRAEGMLRIDKYTYIFFFSFWVPSLKNDVKSYILLRCVFWARTERQIHSESRRQRGNKFILARTLWLRQNEFSLKI